MTLTPEDEPESQRPDGSDPSTTDGGVPAGFDEDRMYVAVRAAVEDALLGAIGTVLLVGVGLLIVWIGFAAVLSFQTWQALLLGGAVIAIGLYIAATTLGIIPPIRDWV